MKATKWMLSVLGRLLQRLGALLVHATDDLSATTSPGARPDDAPPVFDARQAWLKRVAGVPPHAWQGRVDKPPRRSANRSNLVRTDVTTPHEPSALNSNENNRLQAARSASQTTDAVRAWAAAQRSDGQSSAWPSLISAPEPAKHDAPVWDQGTENGMPAPAASMADKRVVAGSLAPHPPQEAGSARGRDARRLLTTVSERLRALVARLPGRPTALRARALRGNAKSPTAPDQAHEASASRRNVSPLEAGRLPPTTERNVPEGATLAAQPEIAMQPEIAVGAKVRRTTVVETRSVECERASTTWPAQTHARQPRPEHEAAQPSIDQALATTPQPPKHASTARAYTRPIGSDSHAYARRPKSEPEAGGVGIDPAPTTTPLPQTHASNARAYTPPVDTDFHPYAPGQSSEHNAAGVSVDMALATSRPPTHATSAARANKQPFAFRSSAGYLKSEHEAEGVSIDPALGTPLPRERVSTARRATRLDKSYSLGCSELGSGQPAFGRFADSQSSQHRRSIGTTAAPMSLDSVEFAAAVWPDLPPLPWAQERHRGMQSWLEFVRLERLDAEQRG